MVHPALGSQCARSGHTPDLNGEAIKADVFLSFRLVTHLYTN